MIVFPGGLSRDEAAFAVVAILILALGVLRLDLLLFRPKRKPPVPAPPSTARHRVGYVIETEEETRKRLGKD